jgi:hypothetical protein
MLEKIKLKIKKNSSTLIIISIVISYLVITSIFGAGFAINPNVNLENFSVNEDGSKMIIDISVNSEAESVRKYNYIPSGDAYYVEFVYTFGIGPLIFGEKEQFTIDLEKDTKGIFFLKENEYELVLYKDDVTNEWQMISELTSE